MADSLEPDAPPVHTPSPPRATSAWDLLVRRDTQVWLTLFTIGGLAVGAILFPSDWSMVRKVAGGLLLGCGATFSVFLPRMIGGHDYND